MNLTELPLLVHARILNNLSTKEKCGLRLVCKRLKEVADLYGPTDLVLHEAGSPSGTKWLLTNEEMRENAMVYLSSTEPADVGFDRDFLKRLRRLCIYKVNQPNHLLVGLNCLDRLEVLNVVGIPGFESGFGSEFSIELPNLKVISVKCTELQFYLNAPKLRSVIEYEDAGTIRFKYPETVRFLKLDGIFERFFENLEIGKQRPKNLEELICKDICKSFDLNDYPNLKKLSIYPDQKYLPTVRWIIEQKRALNRGDLEILVSGYRKTVTTFSLYPPFPCGPLILLPRNLDQIREFVHNYSDWVGGIPFLFGFDYGQLLRHFGGALPTDFTKRVYKIGLLIVCQEVNEADLVNFLKKVYVVKLILKKNVAFTQTFYDLLPSVGGIEKLVLSCPGPDNFNFIFNFKSLGALELEETGKLPLRTVHMAFKSLKSLSYFRFENDMDLNYLVLMNRSNRSSPGRPRSAGLSRHYPYELSFTCSPTNDRNRSRSIFKSKLNLEQAISEIKDFHSFKDLIVDL